MGDVYISKIPGSPKYFVTVVICLEAHPSNNRSAVMLSGYALRTDKSIPSVSMLPKYVNTASARALFSGGVEPSRINSLLSSKTV